MSLPDSGKDARDTGTIPASVIDAAKRPTRRFVRSRWPLLSLYLSAGLTLASFGCSSWPLSAPSQTLLSDAESKASPPPPSTDEPPPSEALRSPIAQQRLKAVQSWSPAKPGVLPAEVLDLRSDPDARVRAAVIELVAQVRPPQAREYVHSALQDNDLPVRVAAIAALGELGGTESQAALEKTLHTEGEVLRAAAVAALARIDAQQAVLDAAGDRSWRVRLAVAHALAHYPNPRAATLARRMLDDPSSGVQQAMIQAIAAWPLELAGPVLLEAMTRSSYLTRKTAAEQLASRWPAAQEFSVDGPLDRRAAILEQLRQRFRGEFPSAQVMLTAGKATGDGACQPANYLAPLAVPERDAARAALDRLASSDALTRRRGARELADLSRRQALGSEVLSRLAPLGAKESDPLVWEDLLAAVATDGSQPATRLVYAAIAQPTAEIRRRACEHLAAYPEPQHATVLIAVLSDENDQVVMAAVRALRANGRLDDTSSLERLLTARNELVRLEAAATLTRLGHPAGLPALERLACSDDAVVRRQLATILGETTNPRVVPLLIRLLDDRPEIRRVALESLPKAAGSDIARSARQPAAGTSEQVALWKKWFEDQQR
jgi:HEAT repeat protein